jgi:dCTP deaminase
MLRLDGKMGDKNEPLGYMAKKVQDVVDYNGKHRGDQFFTPLELKNGLLFLQKDCFSILSSIESVSVPADLACEMASIDDRFGELRSHYAGFIDPGWGWSPDGKTFGRPLTLEVRPFENLYVRNGQPIARIKFERLAEMPEMTYDTASSNYLLQTKAKLAKQFY